MRISIVLPLLATVACGSDPVRRDAERVMQRTLPAGGVTPYLSFTRSHAGVDAEWDFPVTVRWSVYSTWVVERVAPDYSCKIDAEVVRCFRALSGDGYSLLLSPSRSGDALSVHVVLQARPR